MVENEAVPITLSRAPTAIAEISPKTELAEAKFVQEQINEVKKDIDQKKAEINGKVAELEQEQNKEKKE